MKILVIDDDDISLRMFKNALRLNGFECSPFSSSAEALEEIRKLKYDAILTDYTMPDINGVELIEKVREYGINVFIALFSGCDDGALESAAKNAGANSFFTKPIDWKRLAETLNTLKFDSEIIEDELFALK
jgi:DNA-binding response OmpR family regulator